MANTQATFGFKHQGYLSGGSVDFQLSTYAIQSTYSTQIGFGDPVSFTTSTTAPWIAQGAPASTATSAPLVGIFQGCSYVPSAGGPPVWSPFWPGNQNSNATAYVIDAPNAKFLVATLNTAIGSGNIGNLVNFTTGAPTTTGGGFSIATVDQSTLNAGGGTATVALPFRIVGMYQGVGNGADTTTAYNWVVVAFNNQIHRSMVGF
jgi:hypothetical protein